MTPEESLASALRAWHLQAGKPSTRKIAGAVGGVSHTTVNEMLRGSRVPAWDLLARVGSYLGGNVDELRGLWMATQRAPLPRGEAHNDLWDPVYIDRMVVTSFISRRGTRELRTTERWIRATKDSFDRYVVQAAARKGTSHTGPGKANIEPYLNCTIGKVKPVAISEQGDEVLVEVLLAAPLNEGESGFFATRARYELAGQFADYTEAVITGQGAREVLLRVQFAADSVPSKCWGYVGGSIAEMSVEPPAGAAQVLTISSSNYVEFAGRNLPPGTRARLAWRWQ